MKDKIIDFTWLGIVTIIVFAVVIVFVSGLLHLIDPTLPSIIYGQSRPDTNTLDCVDWDRSGLRNVRKCIDPDTNNICYVTATSISCVPPVRKDPTDVSQ